MKRVLILFFLLHGSYFFGYEEKRLVIVTASYNNASWCEKNLSSIFKQSYSNWHLFYIDDCSLDSTLSMVEQMIKEYGMEDHVTLIGNKVRQYHLANQYNVISSCSPDDIIIIIDGDDWLPHDHVFELVNTIYSTEDVWLTYGQFWYWKKNRIGICKKLSEKVLLEGTVRDLKPWVTSHLRTFYAGLFQRIRYEDLLYDGAYYPMCVDVATMMPMIEMAGVHTRFISDIIYVYNDANVLNFYHEKEQVQRAIEKYIRSKERYRPLIDPPYMKMPL